MGQKINPIGLRLGINRGWTLLGLQKRIWKYLIEDFKIRKYIKKISLILTSEIIIDVPQKCTISIHTSRPGFVLEKRCWYWKN